MKLFIFLLSLISANLFAATPHIIAGKYSCLLDRESEYFKSTPYTLEFKQAGAHPVMDREVILTQDDGKKLVGKFDGLVFRSVSGDFDIQKLYYMHAPFLRDKRGKESVKKFTWFVEVSPSSAAVFTCTLKEGLQVYKVDVVKYKFSCLTDDFLGGGKVTINFRANITKAEGLKDTIELMGDEYHPFTVKPKSSHVDALNENTEFYLNRKNGNLTVKGDSDGFYSVDLILKKEKGFTEGVVTVKDDDGKNEGKVTCQVEVLK
jgi:hypothetical protein